MAHLAARSGGAFAVEVEVGAGFRQGGLPRIVADQVFEGHLAPRQRRGAEGEAADRADVVFELRGVGALDRPMAGIVDAGGHFVEHRTVATHEEFACEDADIAQFVGDAAGKRGGFVGLRDDLGRCGDGGGAQDRVAMDVVRRIVADADAILAASDQDRKFVGGGSAADGLDEALFGDAILCDAQRGRVGMDGDALAEPFDGRDVDILELVGHDVTGGGEVGEDDAVMIIGARQAGGGLCGDAFAVGGEDMGAIAHRSDSAGSLMPRIAAASRPALVAPALPIASVPTGMPAGIWTIDSRLSWPDSALLWTGTPRTGRCVIAAAMPGRCAAPPAPAITTFRPRSAADLA
ncbi:hypothetical protein WR25_06960 [Diploscapter pachys]|uniref:Uncharacterized protein n=1 Tax=Diploscapter pachys TaxID=2018661 RepID=A0A2A2K3J8_9BILA|nr:hypothetical protein WR25_06960 [Diploscapter pachys]